MNKLVLRDYQKYAIVLVKNEIIAKNKRIVLSIPTGGGKSLCAQAIIEGAIAKDKKAMFVVNRVQLVDQMSSHLSRAGIMHGIIQGNNTRSTYHPVVIASVDTIHTRGYPEVDILIIDECHSCAGNLKYRKMIEYYQDKVIVGITATHWARGLGKEYSFGKLFETVVSPITIPELIDQGYLVDVDIYAPQGPDLSKVRVVAGEYEEKSLAEASDKPKLIADIVEQWMKVAKGEQTIAFAVDIPHSKHIVEQFIAAGVSAVHVDYKMKYEEKQEIYRAYKNCEFTILSNCILLGEGADFPAASCLIYARATKSFIRYVQICGRIMRIFKGKLRGKILDHSGTSMRLGFPTEPQPLVLDDGKPKQSTGSDKKKEKPLPKPCIKCTYLKPESVHKCPICGFAPERQNTVEVKPGELTKLTPKKNKMATIDKSKLYRELLFIANEKKWSDGRLSHVFRDLAGCWPNFYKGESAIEASPETRRLVQHLNIKFAKSQGKIRQGWK